MVYRRPSGRSSRWRNTTAWWITAFPGLTIVVMALGFSLLADGLGEYLGVRE